MSKKSICKICNKLRWISTKKQVCRPCGYSIGTCIKCKSKRKIYVYGLCYLCYQHRQVLKSLNIIENKFHPISDYNKHIFSLYLKYIKRYYLFYYHIKQAKKLEAILESRVLEKITSWEQVYDLSKKYKLIQSRNSGCAFIKIGYMLQELGVLVPRGDFLTLQINNKLQLFDKKDLHIIITYLNMLRITNRSGSTIIDHIYSLYNFISWCKENNSNLNFLNVNENTIKSYLIFLHKDRNLKYIRDSLGHLKSFYRFCKYKRIILADPAIKITTSRESSRLCVCTESQINSLIKYIKNPNSEPESAILLALTLIWGFKNEDLARAKLSVKDNILSIISRQKKLTKGKRYYNREQVLKLPDSPVWFYNLQKRFYKKWLKNYEKTKKSFPNFYLVLPKNHCHNRGLCDDIITKRIKLATQRAIGIKIPPKVLRQTCGFIHSRNQDASILSTLGWSKEFSFAYTWLPITYFKN